MASRPVILCGKASASGSDCPTEQPKGKEGPHEPWSKLLIRRYYRYYRDYIGVLVEGLLEFTKGVLTIAHPTNNCLSTPGAVTLRQGDSMQEY